MFVYSDDVLNPSIFFQIKAAASLNLIVPHVVDDTLDYDKPSTSRGSSGSGSSHVAYDLTDETDVKGKTNEAFDSKAV